MVRVAKVAKDVAIVRMTPGVISIRTKALQETVQAFAVGPESCICIVPVALKPLRLRKIESKTTLPIGSSSSFN